MIRFISFYDDPRHAFTLYELLAERPARAAISHGEMPSLQEHCQFVQSRPYRIWSLIEADGDIVGEIHATNQNEIGIAIFKRFQHRGYAKLAIQDFISRVPALPGQPGLRSGRWLANIAPGNDVSRGLFESMGFTKIQETYAL